MEFPYTSLGITKNTNYWVPLKTQNTHQKTTAHFIINLKKPAKTLDMTNL
jgi:hypothetical protein